MATGSPVFTISEPQHFSDYGFDPQINYFQVLEEARKHKRDLSRSIDSVHFKLQKPISKDEPSKNKNKKWWENAVLFFKLKCVPDRNSRRSSDLDVHQARAIAFRASISGPVYITESISGPSTPYRSTSRSSSGPLAETLTSGRKNSPVIPYLSLRDLNMEQEGREIMSSSAMPIYLVT